ncbi:PAS domain-containing sensor histidine kinase [Corallococcus carmarthensis]|uniref:histidine kinase n=1 Tax=Corallococcus carmarthensis TaxID=2316728 RepID=A0A3A8KIY4_9BACT|nr:PAS domain-containing sensor histidine kinase [Corallococcus carmarthensis]RKH02372.1 PAS domain S-box protein [Corallococcus carmarthensis]
MKADELFSGSGEMAARMREKDWATTPLGPVEGWPVSLRTLVRTMLHSRHPMFLWWGPRLIQLYNDAYVPSFGRGKHPSALGMPGRECWPEIWPIIGPQIDDVMREGKASWNEDQLVPIFRNGRIEDVYWTYGYSPAFDDAGRVHGTLVVCTETTARVLGEQALKQSKERLRRVVEASGAGTWELDVRANQMRMDERMALLFGLPEAGAYRLEQVLECVHPDEREALRAAITATLAGRAQGRYVMEHRVVGMPGHLARWVEARGQVTFDAEGRALQFVGTALDISDRKRAEEEVLRARQEFHGFLTQAPLGIAIHSGPHHVYTFANAPFMSMLFSGRPAEDLLHKTVRQALPELEDQGYYEILDGVYQTGRSFHGAKQRASMVQADGTEREMFVNFTYQAKRDPAGNIDGILVLIYEVTDQVNEQREIEQLAENLRAAIVSRDTFLGVASHELNTPLTTLKLQTQMNQRLLENQGLAAFTAARLKKLLDGTLLQVDRMNRLINDMLDVSRISSGKLSMTRVETDVSTLMAAVLERFEPQLEAAGCTLEQDIEAGIVARLDATRIEQVLTNFLINAIKYAPGRPVHAKVERRRHQVRFSLRDEGPGIPAEHHERIFVRFERATSPNEVSGLGLGLYIAKQLIQAHGGSIAVDSEPGHGATFHFELPLD